MPRTKRKPVHVPGTYREKHLPLFVTQTGTHVQPIIVEKRSLKDRLLGR